MRRRRAGRVIVRDPDGAVLLCHASAGGRGSWFTPGGGTHDGEGMRDAAIRELAEETGIRLHILDLPVLHRRSRFILLGELIEQVAWFWHVTLDHRPQVAPVHLEEYEALTLDDWRWCPPDALAALHDPVYPGCLAALLAAIDADAVALPWVEEHLDTHPGSTPVVGMPTRDRDVPSWVGPQ